MLKANTSLKYLDLTNTRMGCDGSFMLGAGAQLELSSPIAHQLINCCGIPCP